MNDLGDTAQISSAGVTRAGLQFAAPYLLFHNGLRFVTMVPTLRRAHAQEDGMELPNEVVIAEQARVILQPLIEAFAALPLDARPVLIFQAAPAVGHAVTEDPRALDSV